MPATALHSSGQRTTLLRKTGPWRIGWKTAATNNAAFGTIAAKADIYQVNEDDRTNRPVDVSASGQRVFPAPDGSLLLIMPLVTGADNDTIDIRVWGWEQIELDGDLGIQWHPQLLYYATFNACADVGIAGGIIPTTVRYCDSVTTPVDRTLGQHAQVAWSGAGDDGSIYIAVDPMDASVIEVEGRRNSGATAWNFLYAGASGV